MAPDTLIPHTWDRYYAPQTLDEAVAILARKGRQARVIAGGTDLIIELERGVRRLEAVIDITHIPGLNRVTLEGDHIHLGPLVTHNHIVASALCVERALPLAQAAWEVGAPQIRNRGTLAGNVITASPANDTITPLMALNASVTLRSTRGTRDVPLAQFYTGVRRTVMADDELLTAIHFPALRDNQRGVFLKLGLRRAQAIAVLNIAVVLTFDGQVVTEARIALGAVAPTIIRATEAEAALVGQRLTAEVVQAAAQAALAAARPIDDVRATAAYRRRLVDVLTRRALTRLAGGTERQGWPAAPALLWGQAEPYAGRRTEDGRQKAEGGRPGGDEGRNTHYALRTTEDQSLVFSHQSSVTATVNGRAVTAPGANLTLLDWLRDRVGLTGTKEGCAEGECGACTVFLDGVAVMACLVPAGRAHGAEIVTVEGLAAPGELHPVQAQFIAKGAVQCGYCTPGFIMSAAKLLEERPAPTREQIETALTGNLCRCTGYYKIIEAIEAASAARYDGND
ncbi:MAG: FAD binding domain-containing protein [Anaerolineae bacterium]|nr:FAD binding domain-containing protein [Anaerolineae bacterium]